MDISIIICTRNRANWLAPTLESIKSAAIPAGLRIELVVIDNGSIDHTKLIVQSFIAKGISVRYFFETIAGLSHARNRGLLECRGSVILFTDDDIRVPVSWISEMCMPILRREADAVAGGVSLPSHLAHLKKAYWGYFAVTDGLTSGVEPAALIGANMAFGRHVLSKVPKFDTDLGAGALGFGEETLFSLQLREAGFKLLAVPNASVEHHFDPSRMARRTFLSTAGKFTMSWVWIDHHWKHKSIPPPSRLFILRLKISLWIRRCFCPALWFRRDLAPVWEIMKVEWIRAHEYAATERLNPRLYEKRGLTRMADKPISQHSFSTVGGI